MGYESYNSTKLFFLLKASQYNTFIQNISELIITVTLKTSRQLHWKLCKLFLLHQLRSILKSISKSIIAEN